MISRRIRSTRVPGLWGIKFLVLSMALLVVMSAGQRLAAADRPKPGTEKSKSAGALVSSTGCWKVPGRKRV